MSVPQREDLPEGLTPDHAEQVLAAVHRWSGWTALRARLQATGVECYVCGGMVREVLLGRSDPPKDVDLLVDGPGLEEFFKLLAMDGRLTAGPFGSPRWLPRGAGLYADVIPIRRYYNGLWQCEDVVDALNQFDMTANAVAVEVRTGEMFDPQNGARDAFRRIVRAVRFDYPDEPIFPGSKIHRMTLVWFRLLHYAAAKGMTIEPVTLEWLRRKDHQKWVAHRELFESTFFKLHPRALDPLRPVGR